jgi:hypothetical protein
MISKFGGKDQTPLGLTTIATTLLATKIKAHHNSNNKELETVTSTTTPIFQTKAKTAMFNHHNSTINPSEISCPNMLLISCTSKGR